MIMEGLLMIPLLAAIFALHFASVRTHRLIYSIGTYLLLIAALFFIAYTFLETTGSTAISMLTLTCTMTAIVYMSGFVKLTRTDYVVLFTSFLWFGRFDSFTSFASLLNIFLFIILVSKIRLGRIKGELFHIWFTFVLTGSVGFVSYMFYDDSVRYIGYTFSSNATKLLVWAIATAATILLCAAIIYVIKRALCGYFSEINQMGDMYPKIEMQFIIVSLGILILIIAIHWISPMMYGFYGGLYRFLTPLSLFALLLQLFFLTMFYRVAFLKDSLKMKTMENENLLVYTSDLEKNLGDIKGLRHDMKNIFFTMGQFVEKSSDQRMTAFYREKINPLFENEIAKSDLYSKLMSINNEQLRAFFYYKISQGLERGALVKLEISTGYTTSSESLDLIDITRILGILLDNAIEECLELGYGEIKIAITQNQDLTVYRIENTVNPKKQEDGIRTGVSSKGEHRGLGLTIIRNIIDQYDNIVLNSFFKDGCFVQSLSIYEKG